MNVNRVSSAEPAKPNKPAAPTPPRGGNIENRQPPQEPTPPAKRNEGEDDKRTSTNQVNYSALQTMKEILSSYKNVTQLNDTQKNELTSRLQKANLLQPGAILNTLG